MAEIAIPMAALGIMYILSNDKKKEEGFSGITSSNVNNDGLVNTKVPPENYPVENKEGRDDRYTNQIYSGLNKNTNKLEMTAEVKSETENYHNKYTSLTGEIKEAFEFKHNNMKPFFGSSVTQSTDSGSRDGLLDLYTGSGSQQVEKKAEAPFFKPQKDMQWINGMPSTSEFMQERMRGNITSKMNNAKPWEEIQVGPGLNKGFISEGDGGFNSGMQERDTWKPKTVDELRVDSNPKKSFKGQMLGKHVGRRGPRGSLGKVEQHKPDTFFINNPDRYFTTTGVEKKPTAPTTHVFRPENRSSTTREYFGGGDTANASGIYQSGEYQSSTKQQLESLNVGTAVRADGWTEKHGNYGKSGYKSLPNSRTLTGETKTMGIVGRGLYAMVTPILDAIKPTLKENVVHNIRTLGNTSGGKNGVSNSRVWNPSDIARTTIREQTENTEYTKHGGTAFDAAYSNTEHQSVGQNRDTTTCSYIGNSSAGNAQHKGQVYNTAYNASLNPNKQVISKVDRFQAGNQPIFDGNQNVSNLRNRSTVPSQITPNMPKSTSSVETYGTLSGKNTRERNQTGRYDPNLLQAFNDNPYSQSLSSVA
jgi:hypothetical protein